MLSVQRTRVRAVRPREIDCESRRELLEKKSVDRLYPSDLN